MYFEDILRNVGSLDNILFWMVHADKIKISKKFETGKQTF